MVWWRKQPPEVVDASLDAMRQRDQIAFAHVEKLTEKTGVELFADVVREDGMNGGRWVYEHENRDRLNATRAESAGTNDSETPGLNAALGDLDEDLISPGFGLKATQGYTVRGACAEHEATVEIVGEWLRRPQGVLAMKELVAMLENDHPKEIANATRARAGGAKADLIQILRDETSREIYERLVTRLGKRISTATNLQPRRRDKGEHVDDEAGQREPRQAGCERDTLQ